MRLTHSRNGEGTIRVAGGKHLHYRTWESSSPRAALLVLHGLSEHSGRYVALGEDVASRGISVYALDLRGHGRSDGQRGHAPTFGALLQDVECFRREVLGLVESRTPLFLLGHSMGGLIALRCMEEYPEAFAGAIIVSPWLATAVPVPRWKTNLANPLSRVAPALPIRAGLVASHLSRDPGIVRAYEEDPLVHDRITPRLFVEISRQMGLAFQRADRIQRPLLLLLAGEDRIVDTERTLTFARSLDRADVEARVYEGYFHEVLNEPGAETVRRDVLAWIGDRLAPSAPG